jgi:protein ImuA
MTQKPGGKTMLHARQKSILDDLRARIAHLERAQQKWAPVLCLDTRQNKDLEHGARTPDSVLPFGIKEIDSRLPQGGLALGALHEIAGGGLGAVHGAAAVLFAAGVLAHLKGPVLWCLRGRDLFAPALASAGLHPDRVIYAEGSDEKTVLLCLEEGLRHTGLAAAAGEISGLPMTASRRLQLAAEASGVPALVIRRWRTPAAAADFGQPTAATTRWRISALPSSPLPVAGVGRPRWLVELIRCRAGDCAEWELEACDAKGRLALPAGLAGRPAAAAVGHRRASA